MQFVENWTHVDNCRQIPYRDLGGKDAHYNINGEAEASQTRKPHRPSLALKVIAGTGTSYRLESRHSCQSPIYPLVCSIRLKIWHLTHFLVSTRASRLKKEIEMCSTYYYIS